MISAMNRQKLTTGRIQNLILPEGKSQAFLWDSDVNTLACRVTKGTKAFIFQSVFLKKTIRITIGNISDWKIDNARAEARRLQTLIDTGIDPRQAKAEKKAEAASRIAEIRKAHVTFGTAWDAYLQELKTGISAKTRHPFSERYIRDHINLSNRGGTIKLRGAGTTSAGPISSLLDTPLSELTSEKIAEWLSLERQHRPTVTAHAYRLVRAFLKWLEDQKQYQGIITANLMQSNQVRKLLPTPSTKAGDCLQKEQLVAWFKAVQNLSNITVSTYLQVLLLTGARRNEIATMKWNDIDFHWESIRIRDKVDGERTIPLTPYVKNLLCTLRTSAGTDKSPDTWIFSSESKTGHLIEPRSGHNKALQNGDLPHISLHGLRRSFGTLAEWVEVPTGIVAQIMGHKPSALAEKHYRRRPLDLLRKWHCKIEKWIIKNACL